MLEFWQTEKDLCGNCLQYHREHKDDFEGYPMTPQDYEKSDLPKIRRYFSKCKVCGCSTYCNSSGICEACLDFEERLDAARHKLSAVIETYFGY